MAGPGRGQILVSAELGDLVLIARENVAAVVVRRSFPESLARLPPALRTSGHHRSVALGEGFDESVLIPSDLPWPFRPLLARELRVAHAALRRVDSGAGRAELSVTDGDDCRTFHVDYFRLRLIVTHGGPGTELAPERGLNRSALGQGVEDVDAANQAILSPTTPPFRSRPGEIVLLKGARFGSGLAAVHRSPAIAGTGTIRLVFKLTVH